MRSAIYKQRAKEVEALINAGASKSFAVRRAGICWQTLYNFIQEGLIKIKNTDYAPQPPAGKVWFKR